MHCYVRFNVPLALFLLPFIELDLLTTWVQEHLLKNEVGLDLRIKVVKDGALVFLVIVIGVRSVDELTVIDQKFSPGTALWADASAEDGSFDNFKYQQPDSEITFVNLDTLRFQLERRDEITEGINGLFQILMTKDRAILPMLLYRQGLATAMETAIRAYKSGISASCQEPISVTISNLDTRDQETICSIRTHVSHLTMDELVARCRKIIVTLRRFPFINGEKETTLLETYDPGALKPTE